MDLQVYLESCRDSAVEILNLDTAAAHKKIMRDEGIDASMNWCGYALYHFMRAGGLDASHRPYFPSTQGLLNFGSYYTRDIYGKEIARSRVTRVKETSQDIVDYHNELGSVRTVTWWNTLQDEEVDPDIWPGDIVLVDHERGGGPDHIQIAYSWNPEERLLCVIDGNGGSFVLRSVLEARFGTPDLKPGKHFRLPAKSAAPGKGVSEVEKQEYLQQIEGLDVLLPMEGGGRVSIGCHILRPGLQINPTSPTAQNPHSRVFAVIRPSVADFSHNEYTSI